VKLTQNYAIYTAKLCPITVPTKSVPFLVLWSLKLYFILKTQRKNSDPKQIYIQVEVLRILTQGSFVVAYQRFRVPCCFHLQGEVTGGDLYLCHFSPSTVTSPWRWRQHGPTKRLYPTTTLHGFTNQKTSTSVFTAVKISNLASNLYRRFLYMFILTDNSTTFIECAVTNKFLVHYFVAEMTNVA
jgi:hypothetical protein